jgi:hypothetical protein
VCRSLISSCLVILCKALYVRNVLVGHVVVMTLNFACFLPVMFESDAFFLAQYCGMAVYASHTFFLLVLKAGICNPQTDFTLRLVNI